MKGIGIGTHIRVQRSKDLYPYEKKVLEVGVGFGIERNELEKRGNSVTSIDIKNKLSCDYIVGDFLEYNFNEEKFDCIILSHVIEHINNNKEALLKAKSLLNDDGYIFVSIPLNELFRNDHVKSYNIRESLELIESSGFRVVVYNIWENKLRSFFASLCLCFPRFKKFETIDIVAIKVSNKYLMKGEK